MYDDEGHTCHLADGPPAKLRIMRVFDRKQPWVIENSLREFKRHAMLLLIRQSFA